MLSTDSIEGTNIVTADYSGSVATEEMERLRSETKKVIDRDGSVRLLIEYGDIEPGRIEPKAWIEDFKMAGVLDDVEKLAVVTDASWIQTGSGLFGNLMSGEVRTFDAGERDEALVWLRG
ncbi:hypothetical protein CFK38_12070 [Brachybacterium vulturis]|uniref:STAS/SEC14 domain-containing protein n=1 Tax=Brachybacterium vulturis TaxID=2017484 RepID=A0A291GQA7_9MICO|nr:STAS/SEC14 domain-containing protein [Brachybacterium vulturis]ATG52176.1 hypothetical protein CFK38_12070 [Brachybacterium vulturis]